MSVRSTSSAPTSSTSSRPTSSREEKTFLGKHKAEGSKTDSKAEQVFKKQRFETTQTSKPEQQVSPKRVTIGTVKIKKFYNSSQDKEDNHSQDLDSPHQGKKVTLLSDSPSQEQEMTPISSLSSQEPDETKVDVDEGQLEAIRGRNFEKTAKRIADPTKKNEVLAKATSHYNLSANKGSPTGLAHLGQQLINRDDEEDKKRGLELLEASVKKKDAYGEAYLGYYLINKKEVEDQRRGLGLLKSSAAKKNPEGQFYLGLSYYDGLGELQYDFQVAYIYFYYSAEQKHKQALEFKNKCLDTYEKINARAPDPKDFERFLSHRFLSQLR